MPIHVPLNGGITVFPYFSVIVSVPLFFGKATPEWFSIEFTDTGFSPSPGSLGRSLRFTVSIYVFALFLIYVLFYYTVLFLQMSRVFARFNILFRDSEGEVLVFIVESYNIGWYNSRCRMRITGFTNIAGFLIWCMRLFDAIRLQLALRLRQRLGGISLPASH